MSKKYPENIIIGDFYRHQKKVLEWLKDNCQEHKIIRVQDATKIYFTNPEDKIALLLKFP